MCSIVPILCNIVHTKYFKLLCIIVSIMCNIILTFLCQLFADLIKIMCSISLTSTLKTRNPQMGTFANSEDPDEMQHNAAFHKGLHCLLRQNQSSDKEINFTL